MTQPETSPNASADAAMERDATTVEHATRGTRAFLGVVVALVGVVAAAKPESAVLRALHQAMPQLADAIPTMITAFGAVLAAFSPPPKLVRRKS